MIGDGAPIAASMTISAKGGGVGLGTGVGVGGGAIIGTVFKLPKNVQQVSCQPALLTSKLNDNPGEISRRADDLCLIALIQLTEDVINGAGAAAPQR